MINSIKQAYSLVINNKWNISFIFIIQILLFLSFSITAVITLEPAVKAANTALEYISSLNLESKTQEDFQSSNFLGDDPGTVLRSYKTVMVYGRIFLIISLLLFIIFNGSGWALTSKLIKKNKFFQYLLNFAILTIIFLIILSILFTLIVTNTLQIYSDLPTPVLVVLAVIFLFIIYFAQISFALITKNKFKKILKKTFILGTKKAYIIAPVFILNLLVFSLTTWLLRATIELHPIFLAIAVILFISSFVWNRLLFAVAVNKLN